VLGYAAWLRWSLRRRRDHEPAAICDSGARRCAERSFSRGWIVAWLAGFGSAGIETTVAVPIEDRAASLTANAELPDAPQAPAAGDAAVSPTPMWRRPAESVMATATYTKVASYEPESIVEAALPDPSQMLPADLPREQVATANPSDAAPNDVKEAVSSIEILDECLIADTCIDRYLWALYQRTPRRTPSRSMSGGK